MRHLAATVHARRRRVTAGQLLADWGLHLIDVNLAMGNLVHIVTQQGRFWARRAIR